MFRIDGVAVLGHAGATAHWRMACCDAALTEDVQRGVFVCERCGKQVPFTQVQELAEMAIARLQELVQLSSDLARESLACQPSTPKENAP